MRGVVSAGMTAALERLGLTPCFDLVVGASAGAINGAALLAGVAQRGAAAYAGPLASRSFVSPARVLRGKPVIDVNHVLDLAAAARRGRHERVIDSGVELHCVAVDVGTARAGRRSPACARRTSCGRAARLDADAVGGGAPVRSAGGATSTAGMASPIPVAEAIAAGATHVLACRPARRACRAERPPRSPTG